MNVFNVWATLWRNLPFSYSITIWAQSMSKLSLRQHRSQRSDIHSTQSYSRMANSQDMSMSENGPPLLDLFRAKADSGKATYICVYTHLHTHILYIHIFNIWYIYWDEAVQIFAIEESSSMFGPITVLSAPADFALRIFIRLRLMGQGLHGHLKGLEGSQECTCSLGCLNAGLPSTP